MVRAKKPVSGPGALSERTDIPDDRGQPTRVPAGEPYGARKGAQQEQNAAAMQAAPGLANGAFGPTQRPGEPITAGVPEGPGRSPAPQPSPAQRDPDLLLRALYQKYPHPDLERMLLRRTRGA